MALQWRNKVAVGPRASIPKGPPLPQKTFKKQRRANFGPPTALCPRALHALHALLLRHCGSSSSTSACTVVPHTDSRPALFVTVLSWTPTTNVPTRLNSTVQIICVQGISPKPRGEASRNFVDDLLSTPISAAGRYYRRRLPVR